MPQLASSRLLPAGESSVALEGVERGPWYCEDEACKVSEVHFTTTQALRTLCKLTRPARLRGPLDPDFTQNLLSPYS